MRRPVVIVAGFIALVLSDNPSPAQTSTHPSNEAEQHFRVGSDLIGDNCIDCEGGTRGGMEKGIHEIEAALATGYPDRVSALKLLDDAYGAMSVYAEKMPNEADTFSARQKATRRQLYALAPNDPDALSRYAEILGDEEKIPVLRRTLALDPERNGPRFALGFLLLQRKAPEGLSLVTDAIRRERDPEAMASYVSGALGLLEQEGCALADAEHWAGDAQNAFEAATQGEGNPLAIDRFKQRFLPVLGAHHCP